MDVGQALGLIETPGGDPLEVAAACERLKAQGVGGCPPAGSHSSAVRRRAGRFDPLGQLVDAVPTETATYLSWSPWSASRKVDLAQDLHDTLPDLLDALRTGEIDLVKTVEIVHGSSGLIPETRQKLAERAISNARTHTRAELRAWLAVRLAKLDPEAAEKRRSKAKKQSRVWVQPKSGGMATLGAFLSAEEAQACYASLKAGIAGHQGPVDAARADLLVQRLSGISPADPIPVQVIITPTGPELAGP